MLQNCCSCAYILVTSNTSLAFVTKQKQHIHITIQKKSILCVQTWQQARVHTTCDWHSDSIVSTYIIIMFYTPLFHTTITVQSLYYLYVARTVACWAHGVTPAEVARTSPRSGRPCGVVLGSHKGDVAVHSCDTVNRILHILSHSLRNRQLCNSTTNAIMAHYTRIYAHTSSL